MVARCRCHDPAVFGHHETCALGLGRPRSPYRDYKQEMADSALAETLRVMASRDALERVTMPRGKYAVIGGWLKKRG